MEEKALSALGNSVIPFMTGLSVWYYAKMMKKIEQKNAEKQNENKTI